MTIKQLLPVVLVLAQITIPLSPASAMQDSGTDAEETTDDRIPAHSGRKAKAFQYLQVVRDEASSAQSCKNYVGHYTRLRLQPDIDSAQGSPMHVRNWVSRVLLAKRTSRAVVARTNLTEPNLSSVATLASLTWDSGPKGQTARLELNGEHILTPYFLVLPDSSAQVDFEVVGDFGMDSRIASSALAIVSETVKATAPGSSLVTSENLPQLQQGAAAIDRAVSQFFAEKITEKVSRNILINGETVKADVFLPFIWRVMLQAQNGPSYIGSWRLVAEDPKLSAFSDASACAPDGFPAKVYALVSPGRINNFRMASNKTIAEHLSGLEKISTVTTDAEVAQADDKTALRDAHVKQLRTLIISESENLGFSRLDAQAIAAAYAQSGYLRGVVSKSLSALDTVKLAN